MHFKELVDRHPEILRDRPALTFSQGRSPAEIVEVLSRLGVVMVREALPAGMLKKEAAAMLRAVDARGTGQRNGENGEGAWYSPWTIRDREHFPAAAVIASVIRSWAWDFVEEICGSSHIVLLLKWCTVRHSIDKALAVGGHQDAKVVSADVPFSIWIPLQDIRPCATSGLGFVVGDPDHLLPTLPNNDIGADYILRDPAKLWIPRYDVGDFSIHSRFSPHFTTGYGTQSDRFSLEIRAMPRRMAPPMDQDPALFVSRRNGIPTIVETRRSGGMDAGAFLASADLVRAACEGLRTVVI